MFQPHPEGSSGLSLADCDKGLPSVYMVLKAFPGARVEHGEELKGYSPDAAVFVDTVTGRSFSLYERWGLPRIGAQGDEGVAEFRAFLEGLC